MADNRQVRGFVGLLAPSRRSGRLRRYDRNRDHALTYFYFETTSTAKLPGLTVRIGRFEVSEAGVSIYSAAGRKIFFVFGSNAIVFALVCVLIGTNIPMRLSISALMDH